MTSQTIIRIEQQMLAYLDNSQMKQLHAALCACMQEECARSDANHVQLFLAAKRVEGCSEKTIRYYDSTLKNVLCTIGKDVLQITTDDLRLFLDSYQSNRAAGKTTIDNIRRILSSFFAWLEDEDFFVSFHPLSSFLPCTIICWAGVRIQLLHFPVEGIEKQALRDHD